MRAEDKRVDEVEHLEHQRRLDLARQSEILLETADDRPEEFAQHDEARDAHYRRVLDAVRSIFRDDLRAIENLDGFGAAEQRAFEFLRAAVKGKDPKLLKMIYAEDRKDLLEQALAVLYPTMAHGYEPEVAELRGDHDELIQELVDLRAHLGNLEEAQHVEVVVAPVAVTAKDEDDDEDDDAADDPDADDAAVVDADPPVISVPAGHPGMKP